MINPQAVIELAESEQEENANNWHSVGSLSIMKDGYEIDRFVEAPRKDFQCPICLGVVRNPLECSQCGILLCKKCACGCSRPSNPFMSLPTASPKFNCPVCRCKAPPREPSAILKKIISSLVVYCKNRGQSCQEVFAISEVKTHERVCPYKAIRCSNHIFCTKQGSKLNFILVDFPKHAKNAKTPKSKLVCSEVCKKVILMDYMLKTEQTDKAIETFREALEELPA